MVMPKVSGPTPAVVTVEASVSFGLSSSGGGAVNVVVGPVGAAVVAGASVVVVEAMVSVDALLVEVVVLGAGVKVGLSSLHAAKRSPAAASKDTRRR
jgi:hypothetical protein